ncbi:MAG: 50S ribosomal protein L22 [Planctomycetaceae bacterium]|nr:50S ribosomal protein L22 [Planctomycetaceae bacterium]
MATASRLYQAKHRYAQMSARKIRPFADLVRGKFADDALELLACYPNRGARLVEAVLKSAISNAEDLRAQNIADLEVLNVRIDGGPMARRFRPKARGSSSVYHKRTSHITVEIG